MAADKGRELRYSMDRLVTNGMRIFGWGWAAHPTHAIAEVALRVTGNGWERRLPANCGLVRNDVESAFPQLRNAGASGFVVTGYPPRQPLLKTVLALRFDDGDELELDVTDVLEARAAGSRKRRELAWLARAVWRRLKRGDVRGIVDRAKAQNYSAP